MQKLNGYIDIFRSHTASMEWTSFSWVGVTSIGKWLESTVPNLRSLCRVGLGFILMSSIPSFAQAAGTVTGTVASVLVRQSDGLTYFYVNGTASGQPGCATSTYWMISGETSDAGHKLYAMLLEAKISGALIIVTGAGTCIRWPDGEDVLVVQLLG